MKFLVSLLEKELGPVFKELLDPLEALANLYSFEEAKNPQEQLKRIAKALGVEEASDLNSLLKTLMENKE